MMKVAKNLALITICISICLISCKRTKKNDLPIKIELSKDWSFKAKNDSIWLKTEVPNNIFSDLKKHNKIKDPFYASNEKDLQWVSENEWIYKTSFKIDEKTLKRDNISIIFKGLDTYASIYLNDSLIVHANNMFVEFSKEIKALLKGKNNLEIYFNSPLDYCPYEKPSFFENLPGKERTFTRKAACQFGWDWAPNFPGCGIWQPVYIEAWDNAKIIDTYIETNIEENTAKVEVTYEIDCASENEYTILSSIDNIKKKEIQPLTKGKNIVKQSFIIENPKLWWTHNLGEPYLYNLKTELIVENTVADTNNQKFGIREIELITEKDSVGSSFYFILNGEKIFMNGSNYIPQDAFLSEVDNSKYKALLKNTVDANMNMLRVWGGGIYEKDIFYELCDEYGILIWQDFMYANAMYNTENKFIENISKEAEYQVKRLRNHPCIALWCGNNEIDEAWHNWGWSNNFSKTDSAIVWQDYLTIFHELLPTIVKENSTTDYSTSSPIFGRGNKRSLYEGDAHYWGVWHDGYDFSMFEKTTGRFMSEYGFQSFPAIETLQEVIPENEMSIESPSMNNHQKHPRGNKLIKQYMADYYNIPDEFDEFVYVSQLLQAEGIRQGIEAHKRAKPYCMGTLFWQLNDCWPVVSWSAIDYYGRKKALYYFSRESFKNIIVSRTLKNNELNLFVINDSLTDMESQIEMKLFSFEGNKLWKQTVNHNIKANSSEVFYKKNIGDWGSSFDSTQCALEISVRHNKKEIENKLVYFCKPKNMNLKDPEISCKLEKTEFGYDAVFSTNYLAKNIYIKSIDNAEVSDNFFDLLPNQKKVVQIKTNEAINDIKFLFLR